MAESLLQAAGPSVLVPESRLAGDSFLDAAPTPFNKSDDAPPVDSVGEICKASGDLNKLSSTDFPPLSSVYPLVQPPVSPKIHPNSPNQWSKPPVIIPKASPKFLLKFTQPVLRGSRKIGVCSSEVVSGEIPALDNTLIGFFLGKRPSHSYVKSALLKQWKTAGTVDIFMLLHGGFAFRFSHASDRDEVLETGVYHIGGQPIFLRQWERSIHAGLLGLKHIPLWVSLPGLPLHLWSEDALGVIRSTLGKPLYCDKHTALKTRLSFARVCIEFAGNAPLENTIEIEDDEGNVFMQSVQYDWRPPHCLSCGVFGHSMNACRMGSEEAMSKEKMACNPGPDNPNLKSPSQAEFVSAAKSSGNRDLVADSGASGCSTVTPGSDSVVVSGGMLDGMSRAKKKPLDPTQFPDPPCCTDTHQPPPPIGPPAGSLPSPAAAAILPASETPAAAIQAPVDPAPHLPPSHLKLNFSKKPVPFTIQTAFNRFGILAQPDSEPDSEVPPLLEPAILPRKVVSKSKQSPPLNKSSAGHTPRHKSLIPLNRAKNGKVPFDPTPFDAHSISILARRPETHAVNRRVARRVPASASDPSCVVIDPWIQPSTSENFPPPLAVRMPEASLLHLASIPNVRSADIGGLQSQSTNENLQLDEVMDSSDDDDSDDLLNGLPFQEWKLKDLGSKNAV